MDTRNLEMHLCLGSVNDVVNDDDENDDDNNKSWRHYVDFKFI